MNKVIFGAGLSMLGAVLTMVGCGGPMQEDGEQTVPNDSSEEANRTSSPEDFQPAETPESSDKGGRADMLGSCSYVAYCNAPGADWGTVCYYTPGCSEAAAYNECLREVNDICGQPPIFPFYHWYK